MKDQVTTLMEAMRLSQLEIEKLRRKRQDLTTTIDHVEEILSDPIVRAAIDTLEPYTGSPSVVPEPSGGSVFNAYADRDRVS